MRSLHLFAVALLLLLHSDICAAPPVVTRVLPNGAERGKPVEVVVTGANLTPGSRLLLPFPATQAVIAEAKPNPAQVRFQVTVAASVPLGIYPVRLATEEGVAPLFFFGVDAFPSVVEVEDNSSFALAQKVPVPVIVNGECAGGDLDFFRFEAKKGQRLVIETEAARLGSGVLPQLRLTDAKNRFLAADDSSALHGDCRIRFTAPEDGEYVIEVSDTRFRGAAPPFYRLKIAEYDVIEEVFPLGGRRGETVEFTLRGGTLGGEVRLARKLDDALTTGSMPLTLEGVGRPGMLPPRIAVGDLPERTWVKGDTKDPRALDLLPPLTVNGRLEHKGDADRFQFAVQEGQRYHIAVQAESLGSFLDGVLRVTDQAGRQLALVDDVDFPALVPGQLPSKAADPSLDLTVPAGVTLLVLELRDQRGRGGINFGYRLTIVPGAADFALRPTVAELNVPRGGTAVLNVAVTRHGYLGPLQLAVPQLPPGLTVQGGQVPANGTFGALTVTAAAGVEVAGPVLLRVEGSGTSDGKEIRRWAEQQLVLSKETNPVASVLTLPSLAVALTGAEPFTVQGPPALEVVKGYPTPVTVNLTRGTAAAMAPIEVNGTVPLAPLLPGQPLPPGTFTVQPATAAAASAAFTLTPGPNAPEGPLTLLVQGKAKVNNVDATVFAPATTMTVRPPFVLEVQTPMLALTPGQTVALKGKVVRQPVFKEAVTLRLDGLPAGVTLAAPLAPVAAGATDFEIALKVDPKFAVPAANLTLTTTTTIAGAVYPQPPMVVAAKKP